MSKDSTTTHAINVIGEIFGPTHKQAWEAARFELTLSQCYNQCGEIIAILNNESLDYKARCELIETLALNTFALLQDLVVK